MHPTLLPRHRGRAPIPWAILSGLAKTGVTLFEINDPTADSGPIIGQVEVPIARDETATTLYDRLAEAHVRLVRETVPRIVAGSEPRLPQDPKRASSWLKRTRSTGSSTGRRAHRISTTGSGPRRVRIRVHSRGSTTRRSWSGALCPLRSGTRAGRDDRRAATRWAGRSVW